MTFVSVIYHSDPDGWWADSPDVSGWSATAGSIDDLRELVEDGVRFALERSDLVIAHLLEAERTRAAVTYDFILGQPVAVPSGAVELVH